LISRDEVNRRVVMEMWRAFSTRARKIETVPIKNDELASQGGGEAPIVPMSGHRE